MKLELRLTLKRRPSSQSIALTASLCAQGAGDGLEPESGPRSASACPAICGEVRDANRGRRGRSWVPEGAGPKGPQTRRRRFLTALHWAFELVTRAMPCEELLGLIQSALQGMVRFIPGRT